jgi:hypothetical protein
VLLLLLAFSGWTQSRNGRRHTATAVVREPAIIDIHQIDFKNYTYLLDNRLYKLIDGFYAEPLTEGAQWELAMVDGPYFGDLTGDRKDEVAFVFSHGTVNAPQTAEARVYSLRDGQPALIATFPVTNAVSCELDHYLNIEDGMLVIERIYEKGTACDHNEITQYRWNGSAFMPVGTVRRKPCRCM